MYVYYGFFKILFKQTLILRYEPVVSYKLFGEHGWRTQFEFLMPELEKHYLLFKQNICESKLINVLELSKY